MASVHAGAGDGGLLLVGPDRSEIIDCVPTHGIAVSPAGDRVARLVRGGESDIEPTSLLITDSAGVVLLRRVPILDPHSLAWTADGIAAVSTGTNSIVWFTEDGQISRRWSAGGTGDCWHLNSLGTHRGHLITSAFGRFDTELEWKRVGPAGHGIVYDIETGEVLLSGLSSPHEACFVDGLWIVCNSGTGELLALDADGTQRKSVDLGGWARGMVVDGRRLYVGVTPTRGSAQPSARVATIDLDRFVERGSVAVPASNIFSLVQVSEPLLEGLRAGAHLTSAMSASDVSLDDALPARDCAVDLSVSGLEPASLADTLVTVRLRNRGRRTLSSQGSRPVFIGVRQSVGTDVVDLHRILLPRPVLPGRSADITFTLPKLPQPTEPATLCLVQDGVRWFDTVAPTAACEVRTAGQPAPDIAFVLAVERGPLEWQTVFFVDSLRRWGGACRNASVYAISPRPDRRPSKRTIDELERLGVRYIDTVTNPDTSGYGTVNRIVAGAYIEATTTHEIIVVVDGDTLVLGNLDALVLDSGTDLRARAVDLAGLTATGPDHHLAPYWKALCGLAGIELADLPLTTTTVDRQTVVANYNGGLVAVRRSVGILQRLEKLYFAAVSAGLRPRSEARGFRAGAGLVPPRVAEIFGSAQAALSVAAWSLTSKIDELPSTYNVPLHLLDQLAPTARADSFASAAHVHYHWLLDADQTTEPLRADSDSPMTAEQRHWLTERLHWRDTQLEGAAHPDTW